jgi:predicted metal-binding membrane protein
VDSESSQPALVERAVDRDRLIVLAGLGVATALAWAWIVQMSRDMYGPMSGLSTWMMTGHWDARHVWLLFAMWAVMMAGMMLPSAAQTILVYAAVVRRNEPAGAVVRAYAFASGYLIVWTLFAAVSVLLQRMLTQGLFLTPMMQFASNRAASAVLALAGLYQLTPFKRTCLRACQSPATFVADHWREGLVGAVRMGARHGVFCLGCCWALMLLLFSGGVMHLTTILFLTVFVLAEKALPPDARVQRFTFLTGNLLLIAAVLLTF